MKQIHGFPDLSMGWRYQIPVLVEMGFRVVGPDCMGYGRTVSFLGLFIVLYPSCSAHPDSRVIPALRKVIWGVDLN